MDMLVEGRSTQLADLDAIQSPKQIALLRMCLLKDNGSGLSHFFFEMLREFLDSFVTSIDNLNRSESAGAEDVNSCCCQKVQEAGRLLLRLLKVQLYTSRVDPTLGEELRRQEGYHNLLSKLIQIDVHSLPNNEALQDMVIEIQDIACEIVSFGNFSERRAMPFSVDEMICRLPLAFDIFSAVAPRGELEDLVSNDNDAILIHQVNARQSAQKDVGFGTSFCVDVLNEHRL